MKGRLEADLRLYREDLEVAELCSKWSDVKSAAIKLQYISDELAKIGEVG